jgi:hypothetical protein
MKRAPVTHWVGGRVGPRGGLDAADEEKSHAPANNLTLTTVQLITLLIEQPTTFSAGQLQRMSPNLSGLEIKNGN